MRLDLSTWITLLIQKHSAGAHSSARTWVVWWIKASIIYENIQKHVCRVDFRTVYIQGLREWKLPKKKEGWDKKTKMPRALWHSVSVSLWHEPFGRGCGAAPWPGCPHADLLLPGQACFASPCLSAAYVLSLQPHLPFGTFFLQVYLMVAPQTTVGGYAGRVAWGHGYAAWCKLTATSRWTGAGRKQLSLSCLLHAKLRIKIHKCGSIQNITLIYILGTTGGIVADVI